MRTVSIELDTMQKVNNQHQEERVTFVELRKDSYYECSVCSCVCVNERKELGDWVKER